MPFFRHDAGLTNILSDEWAAERHLAKVRGAICVIAEPKVNNDGVGMQICLTSGTGTGPNELAAFDSALWSAGIANLNLIYLSSVIPVGATLIHQTPPPLPQHHWGDRLYVVVAQHRETTIGSEAWAGIGWVQDQTTSRGLFVEHHGNSQREVVDLIDQSLQSMCSYRDGDWGQIHNLTAGITCTSQPVCALTAAIYTIEPWHQPSDV